MADYANFLTKRFLLHVFYLVKGCEEIHSVITQTTVVHHQSKLNKNEEILHLLLKITILAKDLNWSPI